MIGRYTIVDTRAQIDRSVILNNWYIGERAEMRGALAGASNSVKSRAVMFEGAVVGDHSVVNEGAIIQPGVKIWPNKEIESGAVVSTSIIWGSQGRRSIFGRYGVTGLINPAAGDARGGRGLPLQYVRKISGYQALAGRRRGVRARGGRRRRGDQPVVDELTTNASPRDREVEAEKARAPSAQRYAAASGACRARRAASASGRSGSTCALFGNMCRSASGAKRVIRIVCWLRVLADAAGAVARAQPRGLPAAHRQLQREVVDAARR